MASMESWWQDIRHGLHLLSRNRGFTVVAALSLAIGIGATSALFTVTHALLLRPLPYPDADRIAILWQRSPGLGVPQDWFSIGQYLDIRADNRVFDEVTAAIGASYNLTGQGTPERIDGVRVTSSFFRLFGASAMMGRVFAAAEDTPGQAPTVILAHGYWQRRFGSDPSVIGKTLSLNGNPYTIIGVMPATFLFDKEVMPAVNGIEHADLLLPLPMGPTARANRSGEDFNIFARFKSAVTLATAQADMDGLAGRMKQQYPANYPANGGLTISVVPLLTQVVGDVRLALYILLGAVSFVLLIACGNVANLLLSRGAIREKEIAIRVALGAAHGRVVRQLMTESLLLALISGIAGLAIALGAIAILHHAGPATLPRLREISIDLPVVGFTILITTITSLLFGLVPSLRASRVDPNSVLKEGGRGAVGTRGLGLSHHQLRRLLISAEVALSLVLLVGAGLLTRSYRRITEASPGFDPHHVLSLRVALPGQRYGTADAVTTFYHQFEDRIRQIPGVTWVGANYLLPLSSVALGWEPIGVEGFQPKTEGDGLIIASSGYISQDYFRAMRIPLSKGRFFDSHDTKGTPDVVVVDEQFAQRFWSGQDPLGKRIRQGDDGPWRTVIGVVNDAKEYQAAGEPPITAYYPLEQIPVPQRFMVIRTTGDPLALTGPVIAALHSVDAELPAFDVATLEQRLHDSLARRRFATFLLGIFAAVAVTLAAIGVYGVITYWTNQRNQEIGIRMAMGAEPAAIRRMVVQQALAPVGIGLGVGLMAALALTRLVNSLLFGVSATDLVTFVTLPLVMGGVALLASYVPARRASQVDPLVALRQE